MEPIDIKLQRLDLALPPFEAYRRLRPGFKSSFMLESAVGGAKTVAYSFMGFGPSEIISCKDGKVSGGIGLDHLRERPVDFLRATCKDFTLPITMFPFAGGLVGYFSYEFARQAEPASVRPFPSEFPEFELGLYRECLIYDHSNFQAYYLGIGKEEGALLEHVAALREPDPRGFKADAPRSETTQEAFEEGVQTVKSRITDGETFQTVISRRLASGYRGDLLNLYEALRTLNPSPYMFYLDFGERTVLGSSPETLLTVRGREATTFPIAGTRPLGSGLRERKRYREDLLHDEKERAEHAMLVDLARNDLGRVCEGGSVGVPEYMRVEEFSHVQHIVSKVQGTLAKGCEPVDALCSVFPAGTVSGAPKPRAMEIIGEVEGVSRGPYAGGVGYISMNGNLDSAITIRSAFATGGKLYFQAGAGIVADSDPAKEFQETEQKLGALRSALRQAGEGMA
ncbi:anthranilate synthase component I family protein [Methanomassiliicoccus luminyensis]|uniref:anthranilate synthase component I family protein n=1 Tax=Methanomassiliicoccus luminyensis TaxID=1080712 RepID=UPI00138AC295|nr:anthranilate synthase component I family protein [Methanomassiliicoccus luminyensis]